MLYPNLKFSKPAKGRPFFYTNFVQTVDGKVAVSEKGYWPIGSKKDYETLIELRAYADCLIHGGTLARQFGNLTINSLAKSEFKALREKVRRSPDLPYYIISKKTQGVNSTHPWGGLASHRLENIKSLMNLLGEKGYKNILVEGGPTLLGSFFKEGLIDEVFLTIAPKIYGSKPFSTKTLIEGILLPPNKFKLKLISVKKIKDELFLRYRVSARG